MIVCVGLATRNTIDELPRHPEPDERVVATERAVAGGGPAAPTEAMDDGRRAKLTVVRRGADGCTANDELTRAVANA